MKKSIGLALTGLLLVPMLALGLSVASVDDTAHALSIADGANAAQGEGQQANLFGAESLFKDITNAALFLVGAISVLMIVYGGIKYTISAGDSSAITGAKNTIIYAVVGLVVSLLAYAIVNFVIIRLT